MDLFTREGFDRVKLGIDNNRLSSLLCAILDATGPVLLTKEQAERIWEGRELQYESTSEEGILISLKPLLGGERSSGKRESENSGENS